MKKLLLSFTALFTYYHPDHTEGVFFSHYNSTPYSTYDMSRFLRYPYKGVR